MQFIDREHKGIKPKVIILRLSHQYMINYTYIVIDSCSNLAVIIDPAWQIDKIKEAVSNFNLSLEGILITHAHPDHVHLAKPLSVMYNCPIWISKHEIVYSGYNADRLIGIDSEPWSIGGMRIEPLLTPGHTPGSICFLISDYLFTGDTLFAEGCGMCSDIESAYSMFESLDFLKRYLNPHTLIYPGHMYVLPLGQQFSQLLSKNIYLQFKCKEDFANFRLRKEQNKKKFFKFQ